jgi:DNA polymerase III subunit delta'
MQFSLIPFKTEEKHKIISQVDEDRIPHAQLFIGKEGSANLALALAYISYIYCENKMNGDSCGQCKNCNFTNKYIHPDVHFSFPVVKLEDKKREDTTSDDFLLPWRAALIQNPYLTLSEWQQLINAQNAKPNINTKECNDIIHKLSFRSFSDGPKTLLMWLPEYLGKEGNKLLKLIEEPTDNTFIILVANDQEMILSTILSRCQQMRFLPYKENEIKEYLAREKGLSENLATQYARLSEGSLSTALELLKGEDKNLSSILFDWLRFCYKGDGEEMVAFVDDVVSWTLDAQMLFFEYALHFFQTYGNWILVGDTKSNNMTQMELSVAAKMKNLIDSEKVEAISKTINNLIFYINRNGNKKINIMADTILIGDILRNRHQTSSNYRTFANESLLIQ